MTTSPAETIRELRRRLELTQEAVAEAGGLDRVDVTRVECGYNKGSSARIRDGLAKGLGLSPKQIGAIFAGEMTADQALRARRRSERDHRRSN